MKEPKVIVEHREFLHLDQMYPMVYLSCQLRSDIGDTGSIVVWNKKFEAMCNLGLAQAVPELSPFLPGLMNDFSI